MNAVVSILDKHYYQMVEGIWAKLERELSVKGVYITPYPHLPYQVAQHFVVDQLELILQHFASNSTSFQIKTTGLGIFTGPYPILYIPVIRNLELTQFHQALWSEISKTSFGIQNYYHPEQWIPHITLGFGDINKSNLPGIIRLLSERNFNWEITINNIAFIHDTGTKHELRSRFDFKMKGIL
jgi:2'-5' RNA ligase